MNEPIRIISGPVDDGGCGWYRIRQPFASIKQNTIDDAYIISPQDDMEAVIQALPHAHVMVLRPGAEPFYFKMRNRKLFKHLKWVLDIDDNTELISPYSEHYNMYGLENYYDNNLGKWLWEDGKAGFDIAANRARVINHIQGLKTMDLVTVTTPILADYAKQYNPNVAVLPNSINFDRWWKLPLKKNKQLRVGWSGGISHYEDWHSIRKPLNDLMRQHQFKLVIAGNVFSGLIDEDNKHLIENHDWVPFKGHSYRMMCMNLDLAIIPLADLPFNSFKSAIKWYEFAAMGVPCVVANIPPYSLSITKGDNVFAYDKPYLFKKAVLEALQSLYAREQVSKNALKWVFKHRNTKYNAKLWTDAYRSIL